MAAEGLITFVELRTKLVELAEARQTVEKELEALQHRRERIEGLQRDRDALLESYAGIVSEELDSLAPEERHRIYRMLRVQIVAHADETLEVSGAFSSSFEVCSSESTSGRGSSPSPPRLASRPLQLSSSTRGHSRASSRAWYCAQQFLLCLCGGCGASSQWAASCRGARLRR